MQLALGTVQLGMPYGIANAQGMPDEQTAVDILRATCECGMRWIDTAAAYGVSEATLGSALPRAWSGDAPRIATKFVLDEALAPAAQLDAALEKLRRDRIEALLLHRETDIDHPRFAEFAALVQREAAKRLGTKIQFLQTSDLKVVIAADGELPFVGGNLKRTHPAAEI